MLLYPTLVYDAPYPYLGMRALTRPPKKRGETELRPLYTHPQIKEAIGRSQQTWAQWTARRPEDGGHRPRKGMGGIPFVAMPRYISAYMALLDGGHDTHVLDITGPRGVPPWKPEREFPPIPTATKEEVREFMARHQIS